jgi:topoisomerase-4 subunit B
VSDNGRGIPVDPHPKFQGQVGAGGDHDHAARRRQVRLSKVYETSGGLHGVGVSVVNALSDDLEVEVARNQTLYRQRFSRGHAAGWLEDSARSTTAAAPGALSSRREIFGKACV